MNQRQDLASAVMERDRSRSRMRLITVTVGAASLATAGVVAYNLPGPAHTTAVSGTTTTPAAQPSAAQSSAAQSSAAQSSAASQQPGDDGGSEGSGTVTAPSGTFGQAPAQATSGGS
jgi:hypothetical protein